MLQILLLVVGTATYPSTHQQNLTKGSDPFVIKVRLKGNYSGSKSVTFKINPKGTKLGKLSPSTKKLKVTWKKQTAKMSTSAITGYQVQYGTSSSFSGAKKVTIKGCKTASKTIGKLKSGKKYYVRVRTYKKVGGKTYYSPWSTKKSAKVK